MQNLHQVYQEILDTEKFKTEIQKSKSKFEIKPFVQEWYLVKQIAQMLHPLLSLFSIATGFGFLFYQFASNLNVYAAVIFAIALLIILELMKSLASALTFKRLYLSGFSGINFALLLFAFAFFGLSVFLSVNGAKELYRHLNQSAIHLQKIHHFQSDSLQKYFDKKILAEKLDLQTFKKSIEWQGKINIQEATTAKTLQSFTAKIDSLEADKRKAIQENLLLAKNQSQTLQQNNGFNLAFWFWLALLVEGLIIFSLWFEVWYAWKVSQESEVFGQSQNFQTNLQSIQALTKLVLLNTSQVLPLKNTNDLSFLASIEQDNLLEISSKNQENNPSSIAKIPSIEKDYSGLIQDLKNGISDARYLTNKHSVNIPTLNKYREMYVPNYAPKKTSKKIKRNDRI